MKFIRLTTLDGLELRVNAAFILCFFAPPGSKETRVYSATNVDLEWEVRETPREIEALLAGL